MFRLGGTEAPSWPLLSQYIQLIAQVREPPLLNSSQKARITRIFNMCGIYDLFSIFLQRLQSFNKKIFIFIIVELVCPGCSASLSAHRGLVLCSMNTFSQVPHVGLLGSIISFKLEVAIIPCQSSQYLIRLISFRSYHLETKQESKLGYALR